MKPVKKCTRRKSTGTRDARVGQESYLLLQDKRYAGHLKEAIGRLILIAMELKFLDRVLLSSPDIKYKN